MHFSITATVFLATSAIAAPAAVKENGVISDMESDTIDTAKDFIPRGVDTTAAQNDLIHDAGVGVNVAGVSATGIGKRASQSELNDLLAELESLLGSLLGNLKKRDADDLINVNGGGSGGVGSSGNTIGERAAVTSKLNSLLDQLLALLKSLGLKKRDNKDVMAAEGLVSDLVSELKALLKSLGLKKRNNQDLVHKLGLAVNLLGDNAVGIGKRDTEDGDSLIDVNGGGSGGVGSTGNVIVPDGDGLLTLNGGGSGGVDSAGNVVT